MKRPSHRPERVSELIRQAIGAFLTGDVRDPRIGFVTVIGVDVNADKVARDKLLPTDPGTDPRPDSFYDVTAATLSLSYRF